MRTHQSFRPSCFDNLSEQKKLLENGVGVFEQDELYLNPKYGTDLDELPYKVDSRVYVAHYHHGKKTTNKPLALLPIRNDTELLRFTLNNIDTHHVFDHLDFLIIDDRSDEKPASEMIALCEHYGISLLRVDCSEDRFNFSMLNNLGAALANARGIKEIVFWNADLWTPDEKTIPELLHRFRSLKLNIAGAKLLFPPKNMYKEKPNDFFDSTFLRNEGFIPIKKKQEFFDAVPETVQYGGGIWIKSDTGLKITAFNYGELLPANDPRVNVDCATTFIIGAFMMLNLEWFLKIGGLNPSLALHYQDPEIILRALLDKQTPYYFGKDIFLYHDLGHSTTEYTKKREMESRLDYVLFDFMWPYEARVRLVVSPGLHHHFEMSGVSYFINPL
jgi:GT2 family glycosyltransferase